MAYCRHGIVMCLGQLLTSKIHSNFKLRNEIINKICNPHVSIFLHNKIAPSYVSPYLAHDLSSDWLWVPLLYLSGMWIGVVPVTDSKVDIWKTVKII